jgi:hypothetical protein
VSAVSSMLAAVMPAPEMSGDAYDTVGVRMRHGEAVYQTDLKSQARGS